MKKIYAMRIALLLISCFLVNATSSFGIGSIVGVGPVCQGTSVTLTDPSPGGTWISGNPAIATVDSIADSSGLLTGISGGSVTIYYALPGDTTSISVTISPLPVAGAIIGGSTLCLGSTIVLADTPSGGTWATSNSNATIVGPGEFHGNAAGFDSIWYILTNSCGNDTAALVMNIFSLTAPSPIQGGDTVCRRATILLTDSVAGGTWSVTNTTASILSSGEVTGLVAGGMDTVMYIVSNACGTDTSWESLFIMTTPVIPRITAIPPPPMGAPLSVCVGDSINVVDSLPGGLWTTTSANITVSGTGGVTGINPSTTPRGEVVEYRDSNACGTSIARIDVVVDAPMGGGGITGDTTVCVGATITLFDGFAGLFSTTAWGDVTTNASPDGGGLYTGATPGPDTATFTTVNACGTFVDSLALMVYATPAQGMIVGPDTVCLHNSIMIYDSTGTSGTVSTWSASNSDISLTGGQSLMETVTGEATGSVTVYFITSNTCGTNTDSMTLMVDTSGCINAVNNVYMSTSNITVYPNPVYNSFAVTIPGNNDAVISVLDIYGNTVASYTVDRSVRVFTVDADNLASGSYIVRVNEGTNVYREKIVVIK